MNELFAFLNALNAGNWIAIVATVIGAIGVSFTAANYLAGHRERKLKTDEATPEIKATINATQYEHGWRSVQLHVVSKPGQEQNFKYEHWRIERAKLIRPWSAQLARAKDNDYATGEFYLENPVRVLEGKTGKKQGFALEFFIKFAGEDRGQKARFKVTFCHSAGGRRKTVRVCPMVPLNA